MLEATQKVGIKETGELLTCLCVGYEGVVKARANGKFDTADVVYLVPIFKAIGPAIADISGVVPELKDLDQDELAQLLQIVKDNAPDLASDAELLVKVNACLALLRTAKDCYFAFASKPAASA